MHICGCVCVGVCTGLHSIVTPLALNRTKATQTAQPVRAFDLYAFDFKKNGNLSVSFLHVSVNVDLISRLFIDMHM